jgi:hypothetical protein
MLKVDAKCKEAIDSFFKGLDDLDRMNMLPGEKAKAQANFVNQTLKEPRFRDKVAEFVVNSYISGVGTIAVNAMSALVKAPLAITERFLLGLMPGNSVRLQESASMMRGFFEGMAEGIDFAKAGWARGAPLDTTANIDQIKQAIGGSANSSELEKKIGAVVRMPTKASVAIDEFSKAIFRRMQFNAVAERLTRAIPESKLGGMTREELYQKLRQTDIGSLTWADELKKINPVLADDITNFAKSQTFQADLGKLGNSMLRLRAEHPELVFIAPFIKTPINILKDALSYTPASLFMKQFKGKKDEALARTMIGAGLASMTAYHVSQGNLTGSYPKDAGRREAMIAAGIPEYSVKIGDTWYSYARVEPLATVMGVFADSVESLRDYYSKPKADRKIQELAVDGTLAITKNLTSKTFLEGITGVLQAVHDPERYGGSFINSFAGLVVPAAVAQFARVPDPYQREVRTFDEALQARIPGMREDLPVKRDILGEPKPNLSYGLSGVVGIAARPTEQTPVQREIQSIGFKYEAVPKKIRDVELDTSTYERYAKVSGELVESQLNQLINTPLYQNSNKLTKNILMKRVAERARRAATNQILVEQYNSNPEFAAEFQRKRLLGKGIEVGE